MLANDKIPHYTKYRLKFMRDKLLIYLLLQNTVGEYVYEIVSWTLDGDVCVV